MRSYTRYKRMHSHPLDMPSGPQFSLSQSHFQTHSILADQFCKHDTRIMRHWSASYYNYQLSKALRKVDDQVSKFRLCVNYCQGQQKKQKKQTLQDLTQSLNSAAVRCLCKYWKWDIKLVSLSSREVWKNTCTISRLRYKAKHLQNMSSLSLIVLILSLLKSWMKNPKVQNVNDGLHA